MDETEGFLEPLEPDYEGPPDEDYLYTGTGTVAGDFTPSEKVPLNFDCELVASKSIGTIFMTTSGSFSEDDDRFSGEHFASSIYEVLAKSEGWDWFEYIYDYFSSPCGNKTIHIQITPYVMDEYELYQEIELD